MIKDRVTKIVYNLLYILFSAYLIRFIIWLIIFTNPYTFRHSTWAQPDSSLLEKFNRLFCPIIPIQENLVEGLYYTIAVTLLSWVICILLSFCFSILTRRYSYFKIPVKIIMWFSNFHLFTGYLLLLYLLSHRPTPDWFWGCLIIIFGNGALSGMTEKFINQINDTFNKKYVLFAISQGFNKWKVGLNEIIINNIYTSLEFLPFFLVSTIIIELLFSALPGLGSMLLDNLNNIRNDGYDKIDEIFFIVLLLVIIVRITKVLSEWIASSMKVKLN